MLFWSILGDFWCSVVKLVAFSSNLRNFGERKKSSGKCTKEIPSINKKHIFLRGRDLLGERKSLRGIFLV